MAIVSFNKVISGRSIRIDSSEYERLAAIAMSLKGTKGFDILKCKPNDMIRFLIDFYEEVTADGNSGE